MASDNAWRAKVVFVAEHEILTAVRDLSEMDAVVVMRKFRQVPADAKVLYTFSQPSHRAIGFVVEHESFEPIEPGVMLPALIDSLDLRQEVRVLDTEARQEVVVSLQKAFEQLREENARLRREIEDLQAFLEGGDQEPSGG